MPGRERSSRWDPALVYVVGHQRPDTDAIGSALGYAWLLNALGRPEVVAARAGQPGEQTLFALKRFAVAPPQLLPDVAPTFGHVAVAQPPVSPEAALPAAMARVAEGDRVVPVVDAEGRPTGVVTALALARAYTAPVNVTVMLAQPCQSIAEAPVSFFEHDRISDHRLALLRTETDDFLVVTESGSYLGVASRSRLLQPPRARLILVDHNELSQAVPGAEEADITAVLDHHRLGNPQTALPIPFLVDPVGSTCTLVAERCRASGLTPPAGLAGLLLSGILSDTLVFRSPTATPRDRAAAEWLAGLAGVDAAAYGEELLRASSGLSARAAGEILDADRKSYQMGGVSVSIGQVEVTSLQELPVRRDELLAALDERREREGLSLVCLMVTDVVLGRSRLLCRGDKRLLSALPFTRVADGEFDLGDTVSRKKQLVPGLEAVLADLR